MRTALISSDTSREWKKEEAVDHESVWHCGDKPISLAFAFA
jgi:hypothetical protein